MILHNVRLGLATNSSSSHSMIVVPPGTKIAEVPPDGGNYEWDDFTLVSEDAKSRYLAALIAGSFQDSTDILQSLGLYSSDGVEAHVDHQSLLPMADELGKELFEELARYVLKRPDVVIIGGNDNSDGHPLGHKYLALQEYLAAKLVSDYAAYKRMVRKDGDWWTVFHVWDGTRYTFSFKDDPSPIVLDTPYLVDLKITDYCDIGCAFCYQGSTKKGEHAPVESIEKIAELLGKARVFEVAIGGGEPTQHPHFDEIMKAFVSNGVTVNFTTRNLSRVLSAPDDDYVFSVCGAFALSATDLSVSDLDSIRRTNDGYYRPAFGKMTLQLIPAIMEAEHLKSMLEWAFRNDRRVTLLGYKDTARGGTYRKPSGSMDESKWLEVVMKAAESFDRPPKVSIDTALAKRYRRQLEAAGVPDWLYHAEEGKYSMYIDAVSNRIGPSSYHLEHLVDVPDLPQTGLERFSELFRSLPHV